jgi:SAM-dependent methyltransferase
VEENVLSYPNTSKSLPPKSVEKQFNSAREESVTPKKADKLVGVEPDNGHRHGNFHEYYTFHKCEDRCASLSNCFFVEMWEHTGKPLVLYLLDVGCNEGDLTHEVYKEAKKQLPDDVIIKIVGIDLDSELIVRAQQKYQGNSNIQFATVDIMEPDSLQNFMTENKIESFSLVSCFSITMWIHMNHGDEGLIQFLKLVGEVSNCAVLLEPQLWKSYRKANERCRRRGIPELPHFKKLKVKDIKKICVDIYTKLFGMAIQQNDETPGWGRPLISFSFKPLVT